MKAAAAARPHRNNHNAGEDLSAPPQSSNPAPEPDDADNHEPLPHRKGHYATASGVEKADVFGARPRRNGDDYIPEYDDEEPQPRNVNKEAEPGKEHDDSDDADKRAAHDAATIPNRHPRWEKYNFTDDMQNAILACLIRKPKEFAAFGQIVKAGYFNGPAAVDLVLQIQDYQKQYGKYPDFTALGNFAFTRLSRTNVNHANEVLEYCAKLSEVDTSDWQAVLDLSIDFARERAIYDAIREIHAAQSEGKLARIDPVELVGNALSVGAELTTEYETAKQLLEADIPEAEPVIAGLLDKGMVGLFGASSKSHKTWLNLHLALTVADGLPWLGFKTRKGRVLYLNFELTRKAMQTRVMAVANKLGIKGTDQVTFMHLKGKRIDPVGLLQSLRQKVNKEGFALVIIDPLYVWETSTNRRDGDNVENSNYAMAQTMFGFIELATRANCAVWVAHHFSKGNQADKAMLDRFAGAGVLGRALDTAMTLTKHAASKPKTGTQEAVRAYSVEIEARNHPEVDPFVVVWKHPLLVPDKTLDPTKLAEKGGRPPEHSAEDLLKLLSNAGMTNQEWLHQAAEFGIKRSRFFELKLELKNAGLIVEERTGKSMKWLPSEPQK